MQRSRAVSRRTRVVWVVVALVVLVVIGGAAGAVYWAVRVRVPSEVTATGLAAEYSADPVRAQERFGEKALTVRGIPYFVGPTRFGILGGGGEDRSLAIPCVALSIGSDEEAAAAQMAASGLLPAWALPGVVGILPPESAAPTGSPKSGQEVSLRGVCKGLIAGSCIVIDECAVAGAEPAAGG